MLKTVSAIEVWCFGIVYSKRLSLVYSYLLGCGKRELFPLSNITVTVICCRGVDSEYERGGDARRLS